MHYLGEVKNIYHKFSINFIYICSAVSMQQKYDIICSVNVIQCTCTILNINTQKTILMLCVKFCVANKDNYLVNFAT